MVATFFVSPQLPFIKVDLWLYSVEWASQWIFLLLSFNLFSGVFWCNYTFCYVFCLAGRGQHCKLLCSFSQGMGFWFQFIRGFYFYKNLRLLEVFTSAVNFGGRSDNWNYLQKGNLFFFLKENNYLIGVNIASRLLTFQSKNKQVYCSSLATELNRQSLEFLMHQVDICDISFCMCNCFGKM